MEQKFRAKTTIAHLSWRAEEDELMMSDASFRALEAENICVLITRSLSSISSPFCSPSASMTLALACREAEIKITKLSPETVCYEVVHLQPQLPWLSGVVEEASHPSPQLSPLCNDKY